MTVGRVATAVAFLASLAIGCSHIIFGPDYSLHVSNSTTIPVMLVINEQPETVIEAGNHIEIAAGEMPALPWSVKLTTAAGRSLAELAVAEGSVVDERALDGTGSYSAPFSRTVLTCGSLWIQVGNMMFTGGGIAEGVAGDCDP